jgi:peroxiredoxin
MASWRQNQMLRAGEKAPDFRLESLSGQVETLASLGAGKQLFLVFFKVTCPTCQFTLPYLERLHQAVSTPMVSISQDDAESTREFNAEFEITIPAVLDSEDDNFPASNAYHITNVPSMFLIGPDGVISWSLDGFHRGDLVELGRRLGADMFRPTDYVPEWKAG